MSNKKKHDEEPQSAPGEVVEPEPVDEKPKPIKVRATQPGFYGDVFRNEDDEFAIKTQAEFSHRWMERL